MNIITEPQAISDALLVSYLDNALSPEERHTVDEALARDETLAQKLVLLETGGAPFRDAARRLDALVPDAQTLEARGAAVVSRLASRPQPATEDAIERFERKPQRASRTGTPEWWVLVASIVVAFTLGLFVHSLLGDPIGASRPAASQAPAAGASAEGAWYERVALMARLYNASTFAVTEAEPALLAQELRYVVREGALPIVPAQLANSEYDLVRAQMLSFEDAPLAQFVYLNPFADPIMLFMAEVPNELPTSDQAPLESATPFSFNTGDLNGMTWTARGFRFAILGPVPASQVEGVTKTFAGILY